MSSEVMYEFVALVTVVATAHLLGVSTRRVKKLADQLGVKSLSRPQVSEMATDIDNQVTAFRSRPLDAGPTRSCGSTRSR